MNVPKLRFKDENGNNYPQQKKKKLGDILKICHGKDYKNEPHEEKLYPVLGTGGIITYDESTGVPSLSASTIENIPFFLPCLEEQIKIADFLSAFDRKIDNQKAQLEHLKQIKKGLLQQMFV